MVGAYYRPPHQEEELGLEFSRQLGRPVRAKDVVVMGDMNYPDINWEEQSASSSHSQRFLTCVQDLHLVQEVLVPTRENSILDLVLASGDDLVGGGTCTREARGQ